MKYASLLCVVLGTLGCSSAGETKRGDAGAPAASAAPARPRLTSKESSRVEVPPLAEGQVRAPLFVLPGDARVEVDGIVVRRHQGTVELVGKVGDEHRVRVVSDTAQVEEQIVKITETGTVPASIDARGALGTR